jgi:hypothetical protein
LRVNPVNTPSPAGIVSPGPAPVIGTETLRLPPSTLTELIASVPSWQDRQSFELPAGCASCPAIVSASSDEEL